MTRLSNPWIAGALLEAGYDWAMVGRVVYGRKRHAAEEAIGWLWSEWNAAGSPGSPGEYDARWARNGAAVHAWRAACRQAIERWVRAVFTGHAPAPERLQDVYGAMVGNTLQRAGLRTCADVEALPDQQLLALRNLGRRGLARIRAHQAQRVAAPEASRPFR